MIALAFDKSNANALTKGATPLTVVSSYWIINMFQTTYTITQFASLGFKWEENHTDP